MMKKMNNKNLFLCILVCLLWGCNKPNMDINETRSENDVCVHKNILNNVYLHPFASLYLNDKRLLSDVTKINMQDEDIKAKHSVFSLNMDANTFYDDKNIGHITIKDSLLSIDRSDCSVKMNVRRLSRIQQSDNIGDVVYNDSVFELRMVDPIQLIRPYGTDCYPIPYCYFEDMEIEWNADVTNNNGVIVFIEWDGLLINDDAVDDVVIGIDVLPDVGVYTLNNSLFDNIPDGALVRMKLIRANVIEVYNLNFEEWITDSSILSYVSSTFSQNIETLTLASTAICDFSFILVREL